MVNNAVLDDQQDKEWLSSFIQNIKLKSTISKINDYWTWSRKNALIPNKKIYDLHKIDNGDIWSFICLFNHNGLNSNNSRLK